MFIVCELDKEEEFTVLFEIETLSKFIEVDGIKCQKKKNAKQNMCI